MKSLALILVGSATLCSCSGARAVAPATPELRFCPEGGAWVYPLNDQRELNSLVVQSAALRNTTGGVFEARSADLELLNKGEVKDRRHFSREDLVKATSAAPRLQGMAKALPGQFCKGRLYGNAALAATPQVAPGQALLLSQQTFAWAGARDAVRLTVRGVQGGQPIVVSAEEPIRAGASKTAFHFPLRGSWLIGAGPSLQSHHRWGMFEEFAYDILRADAEGKTHTGDGLKPSDYLAYGAPILAASDGVVVAALDGEPEMKAVMREAHESEADYTKRFRQDQSARLARGAPGVFGNHVIIDHGNGEFSMYAHMKPGSVRVKPGQRAKTGEPIGELGSSGNSTEPHLHFQVCSGPEPLACASVPVRFVDLGPDQGTPQTGDVITPR